MAKCDSKGNKIGGEGRFFALQHHMLNSDAWRSLTPQEVAVFLRVAYRYYGENNGRLALSARDAGKEANVSKNTASKALRSLCEKGFLRVSTPGGYSTNGGKATEYELTCVPLKKGRPAKRDYQAWKPLTEEKSQYHIRDTAVPYEGQRPKLRVVK